MSDGPSADAHLEFGLGQINLSRRLLGQDVASSVALQLFLQRRLDVRVSQDDGSRTIFVRVLLAFGPVVEAGDAAHASADAFRNSAVYGFVLVGRRRGLAALHEGDQRRRRRRHRPLPLGIGVLRSLLLSAGFDGRFSLGTGRGYGLLGRRFIRRFGSIGLPAGRARGFSVTFARIGSLDVVVGVGVDQSTGRGFRLRAESRRRSGRCGFLVLPAGAEHIVDDGLGRATRFGVDSHRRRLQLLVGGGPPLRVVQDDRLERLLLVRLDGRLARIRLHPPVVHLEDGGSAAQDDLDLLVDGLQRIGDEAGRPGSVRIFDRRQTRSGRRSRRRCPRPRNVGQLQRSDGRFA